MTKIFFVILLFFCLLWKPVSAQHFESSSYNIDWGNFNMTSGKKTSANYSLTDTVGQNAPGEYSKTGFKLKSGFQYIYPFDEFSFEIDNLNIDFGTLTASIASTAVSNLTTTTPSGQGFQIIASESSPLRLSSGTTIPDFPGTNSLWTDSAIYGFGFNANTSYFSSANHFSSFSNQILDSSNTPVKNHITTITYKVNISNIQTAGDYQNYIVYTAIPKY
ncbi:MAG: hypothetical protein WC069_00045 [Candidatus Shapirobacteria bacterium]